MTSLTITRKLGPLATVGLLLVGPACASTNTIDKIDNVIDEVENAYNTANGKLQRVETSVKRIDNAVFKGKIKTITQRRITATDKNGKVKELNRTGVIGRAQRASGAAREGAILIRELTTLKNPQTVDQVKELQVSVKK